MPKIQIFLLITFVIFSLFVWGEAKAGPADNVSGWAWSENIGWISFNCNNPELPTPRCTNDYGVNIDPSGGSFSGYAWSENIGWIDFAPSGLYPGAPNYSACLDLPGSGQTCDGTGDYKVSGWARAVVDGGGWSGWIKLKDTDYEVSWNSSSGEMEGWAWSDMVIGWISFNHLNCDPDDDGFSNGIGDCPSAGTPISDYKVIAALGNLPDTIIDSGPSSPTKETSVTFTFHGTESPTSFKCQLDGGGWLDCSSGEKNYIVSQGSHTFKVKAINVVGEDPTPASWTWLVDTTDPQVTTFDVSPSSPDWVNEANPNVTISWTVTDLGGSHLSYVEVWRKPEGGEWVKIGDDYPAPVDSDSWSSSALDSPSNGTWWYGLHVLDKAGNMGTELSPIEVLVDKVNPSTGVTNPTAGSWHNDDFTVTIDDSDIGDSGLAADCEYLIVGLNPEGDDCSSGVLSRSCDPVNKNIPVGPGACTVSNICIFEGTNRCKVNTRSYDNAGNNSDWKSRNFSIDFTEPTVGEISPLSAQQGITETFTASLKDEIGKISGCWLYVDGSLKDKDPCTGDDLSIVVNPIPCENGADCTVSVNYCFNTAGSYQMRFSCRDLAGNYGWGNLVTVTVGINNFPVITDGPSYTTSPCAQPTTQSDCNVNFTATIKDDDGDDLTYIWDFGDGVSTDPTVAISPYPVDINTSHHYDTANVYTVILTLSDGRGGEASNSVEVTVTDPTLLVGLVADPNSGVNFLNDVDLTATVSGTTHGTINYYFDCNYNDGVKCENDTTCPGYVEKGDCCDEKALDQESETHVAVDLCDYASPGDYITRVFIERGAGTTEDTITITIGENQPPLAAISCCPESCDNPAGECIGYTQSNFCLRNDSTDPDGIDDIENSIWTIKEGEEIKEISDCSLSGNPLCDWTLLFTFSRGTYIAELYVEDFQGASDTATQNFIIKQDAIADFKCSLADLPPESPDWQSCEVTRPTVDEVVYFLDQSSPSEGASTTNRSWVFQDGNPASNADNEINPFTQFQSAGSKQVSLTITDSAGRTASQDHFITVALPLPEWREIPPF